MSYQMPYVFISEGTPPILPSAVVQWLQKTARASPMASDSGTYRTTRSRVARTEGQNDGSVLNILRKLSKPTNFGSDRPLYCVNAKYADRISG